MDNQGLYVSYIGEKGENLQPVDKGLGFPGSALDFKGKYRAAAPGEVPFIELVMGALGQGGVVYIYNRGLFLQESDDLEGVYHMPLHPERASQALQEQEGIEGAKSRAGIAKQGHSP